MKENTFFDYAALRQFVLSVVPAQPISYIVSLEQQDKEIESLKTTLGSRRFFFVTNLENFEIEQASGVARWLGYCEKDFTMKKYLDILDPGRKKSLIMVAMQLYSALCSGKFQLNFMVQRYSSQIVLKHHNGELLVANKISSVFQFDKDSRLTAYLNEFTITGRYDHQPMEPEFFTSNGGTEHRGDIILQETIKKFLEMKVFAPRELQMARQYIYSDGSTKQEIGAALNITTSTVDELGKRFLVKARDFFHIDFRTVLEAAKFIKKEGLL